MRYIQTESLLKEKKISVSYLDITIYDLRLDGIVTIEKAKEAAEVAVQNLLLDGYRIQTTEDGVQYIAIAKSS